MRSSFILILVVLFCLGLKSQQNGLRFNIGLKCYLPFYAYATPNVSFINYVATIPNIGTEWRLKNNMSIEHRFSAFLVPKTKNHPSYFGYSITEKEFNNSLQCNRFITKGKIKYYWSIGFVRYTRETILVEKRWRGLLAIGINNARLRTELRYEPSTDFILERNLWSLNFIISTSFFKKDDDKN